GNESPGSNDRMDGPMSSPDGTSLILRDESGLFVMRTHGSEKRQLDADQAAWSPDGKRVAFVRSGGGISVSDADGRHVHRLTSSEEDSDPTWSPDGKHIAFTSYYGGPLKIIDADGKNEHGQGRAGDSQPH